MTVRTLVTIVALIGLPGIAMADDAADHLEQGLEHYADGEYELAIDEFIAGYELDARPELLFALAQAERLSGDCASATIYYRDFLATEPPDAQRDAAQMHLDGCDGALASTPRATREDPESDEVLEVEGGEPIVRRHRWYDDVVGDVLLGAGALGVLISVRLYGAARTERDLAESADDFDSYTTHRDRAMSRRNWALGTFGIGAGLIAGAVYRFVRPDRDPGDERDLVIGPAAGGIGLSVGGVF